jgi:DNA-binding NarL/FixJ family response regulator
MCGQRRMAVGSHLVGRAEELALIDRVLADLEDGRSAVLQVVGEPGIGKTRLLAEAADMADRRGHLVLTGTASELERDLPFGVFVDALVEYVRGLEPSRFDALDEDVLRELATVLPPLAGGVPGDAPLLDERYRTHRAVGELLQLLAVDSPLVLVLDDLHWADPGSVELLGSLLRRPPAGRVLIVLGFRPRQVPERLAIGLARALRDGTSSEIVLGALGREEAHDLLGEKFERASANALYAECGGNPFYLEQLARAFDRPRAQLASSDLASLAGIRVPAAVAAALREELELLGPSDRLVLEGAAVAGDPFDPDLAAAAAGVTEASAIEALDQLLQLNLVRETDVPRRYRFRHPLVRRAVYESTLGGWRLGAHERVAEALLRRGAPAAVRAHHVERSAREGDAAAIAVLREAGETTARRSPSTAARWFQAALHLLRADAPPEQRIELLMAQAQSLVAAGQFTAGHAAFLECLSLVPAQPVSLRVRLVTACAAVEHLLGHHGQAYRRLEEALGELDDPGSSEAVSLLIELAVGGYYRMDYGRMSEWANQALSGAKDLGSRSLEAAALAMLAYGSALAGDIEQANVCRAEAAALVDALPDDELALRLDAAVNLAAAELNLEHFAEAAAHGEQALAVARATEKTDVVPHLVYCLGWVRRRLGQLETSRTQLEGAVEAARLSGNVQSLAGGLLNLSLTALDLGDLELALTAAEESVDLTRQLDSGMASASAGLALAAALLEAGDAARAVDTLVVPAGGDDLALVPKAWRHHWLELLARCWLALDRLDDARRAADLAQASARSTGLALAGAIADRAVAAVALASHEPATAAQLALGSAAAADQAGAPIESALSAIVAGRALAQTGNRKEAVTQLRQAADTLDACGALRYRKRAEQELRVLGYRPSQPVRTARFDGAALEGLTQRELEVARLVVDRKTNPEIAAELFLSQKTVETHLRNMFRKLNVATRVELARAVERADRAGSGMP